MDQIDRNKILKMLAILALLFIIVGVASHLRQKNSITLDDYAKLHPSQTLADGTDGENGPDGTDPGEDVSDVPETEPGESDPDGNDTETDRNPSTLIGALLNGGADGQDMLAERIVCSSPDFYAEPLSKDLRRYITGISYPAESSTTPGTSDDAVSSDDTASSDDAISSDDRVSYDDLRYVHILHYGFDGAVREGELICNAAIARDLLEIFYELYRNEYQIEKVLLMEEYDGNLADSAADNNTFCFCSGTAEDPDAPSRHALGMALDINPLYNPCITYREDGGRDILPDTARKYADRDLVFPYKIDEDDLCCKLFLKHGFTWGGNRNSRKDYCHFQKASE